MTSPINGRIAGSLAGFLLFGGLAASHMLVANRGDQYVGVLLILDHLFSLTLVLGLFAIAAGVGGRLLRATGLELDDPLEALLFWTALGIGTVASAIVIVGLVSVRPVVLCTVLLGAALTGRRELGRLPALVRGAIACVRMRAGFASQVILLIFVLFLVLGALMPPTDWDALMYHLRVPDQFLRSGAIRVPDDSLYAAFVGLPHMLYLPLLAVGSPAGPGLVSALCTLGLALATFSLGTRFLDARTARFGLLIVWGSTILLVVGVTPRTDTILAFYLLLAHHAVLRARESENSRFLYLAAALGGMAFGVKYNAIAYLVALAPLALWIAWTERRRTAAVALALGIALAAASPWLLKNALLFGDPVYPYLSERRLDTWLAQIYSSATHPPLQADSVALPALWSAQTPFNFADFFFDPRRISIEAEGVSYHANVLLLLLPLSLLFWRHKNLAALAGPALGYVVLLVLLHPTSLSLRYLIPALAPLTLVAFFAVASVLDKLVSAGFARVLLWAMTLFVLRDTASFMARQVTAGPQLDHLVGSSSRETFLKRQAGGYADVVSVANARLPQDGLLLMLFDARGYYFRTPVLQDNGIANWPLLVPVLARQDCLRSTGITHVLLNRGAIRYYARRGVDPGTFRLDALERFARDCLTPIYSSGGITLFQIGATGVRGASPERPHPSTPAGFAGRHAAPYT